MPKINNKTQNDDQSASRKYTPSSRGQLIKELSERSGLNQRQLWQYSKDGCNLENDDDVRAFLDTLDKVPSTVKASFYTSKRNSAHFDDTDRDVESLKKELLLTRDKNEAAVIKTQLEALKIATQLEVLNNNLISIPEVENAMVKIGSSIRSMILKMQSELPPQLNGMAPPEIQKKLNEYGVKMLSELSNWESYLEREEGE